MNKKINVLASLFLLAFLCNSTISAQLSVDEDGIYYDNLGKPYTGIFIEKYDDGTIKGKTTLISGRKHGLASIYFKDGSLSELRMYRNNQMHGTWVTWNEKGKKTAEANYAADKKNGKWYIWDENGVKRYEMIYFDGEKAGTWYMWDEKGELTGKKDYSEIP
ncbi:MAG: toxin-antitoxin system YwqK family antitoxin [Bacteroidales bacterium]